MAIEDLIPSMDDAGLANLRDNARRLKASNDGRQQEQASLLLPLIEAISQLESRSDTIYDDGMKALYRSTRPSDAMGFMIGSEIYSHLERVVDRFEDVSNHINGILLENL